MTGVDITAKCHKRRWKVLHFSSLCLLMLAFLWAGRAAQLAGVQQPGNCAADCWRRDSSSSSQGTPSSSFDRRPLSAAESRTSLSRLPLQPPPPMPCSSSRGGTPRPKSCPATGQSLIVANSPALLGASGSMQQTALLKTTLQQQQ